MNRLAGLLLLAMLAAFVAGLVWLLQTRFARGDIYPPGSSLRADPLGTRALHDALARITPVSRHVRPLAELGDGRDATLFYLGAGPNHLRLPEREFTHLERFVSEGGRLVIALRSGGGSRWDRLAHDAELAAERARTNAPRARRSQPREELEPRDPSEPAETDLEKHWGFRVPIRPDTRAREELQRFTVRRQAEEALPSELTWYTPGGIGTDHDGWRALYARAGDPPVAIERRVGRGSVVVLTDTWHFTNEALRDDRQPAWLAWLAGTGRRVIFNETHLGIIEEPGVATLLRRYRLHGFFAALLALAALFIWRNSASFPPAPPAPARNPADAEAVRGREAAAGFVSLLRRNLPVAALAETCFAEWRRACARSTTPARLQAVEAAFATEGAQSTTGRGVTALYRKLALLLHRSDSRP